MKLPSKEQWLYLANILVSRWVNSGKDITSYSPETILCVKWDEIGDMASCTHVFSLLKKRFPDAEIDVLTKPYSAALLENHPAVNRVITDIGKWNKKYDFIIELRGNAKTLRRTFKYYPKVRLDRGLVRLKHKGKQLHETRTNYEIIEPILGGIPFEAPQLFPSEKNQRNIELFLTENKIDKFAVFHVGARSSLRRWTDSGFAQMADYVYKEKGLHVVFAGVAEEEVQIERITKLMNVPYSLFTQNFSLMDLAALLEKASLFLGNESGPLQIADVMQVPLVGLFGPGVKDVFYPQHAHSRVIHHVLECNPCDQVHCVRPENPCMNLITIEQVKMAVNEVGIRDQGLGTRD